MGNKTTGRNWTRRSIEEIFDDMFAKKGGSPGPSPSQGDIYALTSEGTIHGDVAMGANYFRGYQSFALAIGTVKGRYSYRQSGIVNIDVMRWKDFGGVTGIMSLMWSRRSIGNARLLYIPTTGSDLYSVSYYGEEAFTLQVNNVTAEYTSQGTTYQYYCSKFPLGTATNLDGALQACPGYGSGGNVLLVVCPFPLQDLDDTSLLSIANTVLFYYQSAQQVNNIIRV